MEKEDSWIENGSIFALLITALLYLLGYNDYALFVLMLWTLVIILIRWVLR